MKNTILGTQQTNSIGQETQFLHDAGVAYMQRLAGYIAPTMPVETPILPPLSDGLRQFAILTIQQLYGGDEQRYEHLSPNLCYILLAWLFISPDSPYYQRRLARDRKGINAIGLVFLSMACGSDPMINDLRHFALYADRIAARGWKIKSKFLSDLGLELRNIAARLNNPNTASTGVIPPLTATPIIEKFMKMVNKNPEVKTAVETVVDEWLTLSDEALLLKARLLMLAILDTA